MKTSTKSIPKSAFPDSGPTLDCVEASQATEIIDTMLSNLPKMEPQRVVVRELEHPTTGRMIAVTVPVYGPPDLDSIMKSMRKRRSKQPRVSKRALF